MILDILIEQVAVTVAMQPISYRRNGKIFDISREGGYPINARRPDIKYHAD